MGDHSHFLFVNKDATNYGAKDHLAAVNSFVQRHPKAVKKDRLYQLQASVRRTRFPWRLRETDVNAQQRNVSVQGLNYYKILINQTSQGSMLVIASLLWKGQKSSCQLKR